MVLFCRRFLLADYGSCHNTEAADEQQSNPKPHHTVIAGLRRLNIIGRLVVRIGSGCTNVVFANVANTVFILIGMVKRIDKSIFIRITAGADVLRIAFIGAGRWYALFNIVMDMVVARSRNQYRRFFMMTLCTFLVLFSGHVCRSSLIYNPFIVVTCSGYLNAIKIGNLCLCRRILKQLATGADVISGIAVFCTGCRFSHNRC